METNLVDAVLISSKSNVFYLSDFYGLSQAEREAYCFVTKNNAFLITSPLYEHDIKHNGLTTIIISRDNSLTKVLTEITQKESVKTIGYENTNITVFEFNQLQKINVKFNPLFIGNIRIEKTKEEIEKVRRACEIGDKVFDYILDEIKIGRSEMDIAARMEIEMRKNNCLPSFSTIVAYGKNAAVPHHSAGKDKLEENQFVLLDFGVINEGYCSDMTRTIYFGKPENFEKKVYEIVRASQEKAVKKIESLLEKNSRVDAKQIDKVARGHIISRNFPEFPHSLGHGIGIDVHESPSLSPFSKDTLAEGMVFSIEPGIYIPGKIGVRIEDLFTIQDNKLRKLTNSPVDLLVL